MSVSVTDVHTPNRADGIVPSGYRLPQNGITDGQREGQIVRVVCPARGKVHGRILAWLASASDHSLSDNERMQHLTLYSTSHCSLCDQPWIYCLACPGWRACNCGVVVGVADDDSLFERYGEKIPVLRLGERKLHAPFGAEELARFLRG